MKIKIIVFDTLFHEIQNRGKNGWSWFKDPWRDILLLQMAHSLPPEKAPIDAAIPDYDTLLKHLAAQKADPSSILFVSDFEWRLIWAKARGFYTLAITSGKKTTMGGDYACAPHCGSIAGYIHLIEHLTVIKKTSP